VVPVSASSRGVGSLPIYYAISSSFLDTDRIWAKTATCSGN
jgi:hypothetical protein